VSKHVVIPTRERTERGGICFSVFFGKRSFAKNTQDFGCGDPLRHCSERARKERQIAGINKKNKNVTAGCVVPTRQEPRRLPCGRSEVALLPRPRSTRDVDADEQDREQDGGGAESGGGEEIDERVIEAEGEK
jgi:hypothetical protein